MSRTISNETSRRLSDLENVMGELTDQDAEFIGLMTQRELDGEAITYLDETRITRLHAEHCE